MWWFSRKKKNPYTPVYCEDCKWGRIFPTKALCARPGPWPNSITRAYPGRLCEEERSFIYACGPRGQFFEPKEVPSDQSEG